MSQTLIDYFWDGENMTYTEGFATTFMKSISLLAGLEWFIAFAIHIALYLRYREQKFRASASDYRYVDDTAINIDSKPKNPKRVIALEIVSDLLFWGGAFLITLIFSLLSGFEFISTSASMMINILFFILVLSYQTVRLSLYSKQDLNFIHKVRYTINKYSWILIPTFVLMMLVSIFLPLLFRKSCLCLYNTGYGVPIALDMEYSSQFTRGYWLPDNVCPEDELCHVYATLPSNTSSSVFINIHSGVNLVNLKVIMQDDINEQIHQCERITFSKLVEFRGQRNLYTCLINDLKPDNLYQFQIVQDKNASISLYSSTYKTLPSIDSVSINPLRIFFGGDYGYQDKGRELVQLVYNFNPDLILIGGDIAYDNGNKHCYYSWDLLLWNFEDEFNRLGRIVPFLFSVGNHDVGFNSLANINVTISEDNGPFYFTFFPQNFANELTQQGIPKIEDRVTYTHQFIKNLLFVGLDSGYLYGYEGQQSEWLEDKLQKYGQNYSIFIHYHNPIYPTCWFNSSIMSTASQVLQAMKYWVPIFDKYNVVAAFENHVHQFKRTHQLVAGKVVNDQTLGTMYFGDGAMGIKDSGCRTAEQTKDVVFKDIFAAYQVTEASHIWIMDISPDGLVEYNAYGPLNKTLNGSYYKQVLSRRQKFNKNDDL